ncbi:cytochrome-c oxidase, cbb3-type subunit III [Thauera sp. WH-2]|jgi:cytochrome c oxidase cbb3-type subunit 3|uniref:cytochrome-c oxidase, cbb3-type subunit III n=1 Tax=unclassified Thauera TaxID=2609274 RepID=UPI002A3794FE|nr:cytochrome-c oxidase, cbb3-type subunit III [Thauera sp.]
MADFISGFWNMYVMVLVALSILFCVFVLVSNMTRREKGPVELHGHVWDESLAEYNNPLPRWWMYLFWITIFFGIGYLAIYPGFGSFNQHRGQWAQYDAEMRAGEERFGPVFAKYREMDVMAVAAEPEAVAMGQRLFLTYCQQCHGAAAQGAKSFPNLTDGAWLWGGEPDNIRETITNGRNGIMTPFGAVLGSDGVKDVANYVRSMNGLAHDSLRAQRGKDLFDTNCIACHGADAKGNPMLGAPNLTDNNWLYGSTESTIIETITHGRNNKMPAFGDFLGEDKVHILTAYVLSLNKK